MEGVDPPVVPLIQLHIRYGRSHVLHTRGPTSHASLVPSPEPHGQPRARDHEKRRRLQKQNQAKLIKKRERREHTDTTRGPRAATRVRSSCRRRFSAQAHRLLYITCRWAREGARRSLVEWVGRVGKPVRAFGSDAEGVFIARGSSP